MVQKWVRPKNGVKTDAGLLFPPSLIEILVCIVATRKIFRQFLFRIIFK